MRPNRSLPALALAAALLPVLPSPARAQEAARPEVGHALESAEAAIRAKRFDLARAEVGKADAAKNKSAYETLAIEQTRGALAQASGDTDGALTVFRHLLAAEKLPLGDRARMEHTVAALAFGKQDYATSSDYAGRAIHDGDADPALPLMVSQSAYASGDYPRAYALTLAEVQAQTKPGGKPPLPMLQMLASAAQKSGNDAAYGSALELMAANYPDPTTAQALVVRLQAKPGVANRYGLDITRLKHKLGLLTTAMDYEDAAQSALSNGYPGEASAFIKEAYDNHLFGQTADAARQDRLKAYADKQLAADRSALPRTRADAADAHDGGPLVRVGYDILTQGDAAGLALIEQGVKKGGMARPDQAALTLGEAYVQAGRPADALATFRTVKGADGAADVAHLWMLGATPKK